MVLNLVRIGHMKHTIYMCITIAHGTKLDPWHKMQSSFRFRRRTRFGC